MEELRITTTLRPTRIAFLVKPTDKVSVRKIMRINACLWGGMYNPIIPVYRRTPKEWIERQLKSQNRTDISRGYIKFFEPEVFVESEEGLLESIGFDDATITQFAYADRVVALNDFFKAVYQGAYVPIAGQSVFDLIVENYKCERKFQLRDEHPAIYPSKPISELEEACIGAYPESKEMDYFLESYQDVYRPNFQSTSTELWLKILNDEVITPLTLSSQKIEVYSSTFSSGPLIYIFNPKKTVDLIDLWNLRIEHPKVYPIPLYLFSELVEPVKRFIEKNHFPINDNGVMNQTTIEISRSIEKDDAKKLVFNFLNGFNNGEYVRKMWRTQIWNVNHNNHFVVQPEKLRLSVSEKSSSIKIEPDKYYYSGIDSLAPSFSNSYSGTQNRWVNVVKVSSWAHYHNKYALCLPHNTFLKNWLYKGINGFNNGREGWIFTQKYKDFELSFELKSHEQAFIQWFKLDGVSAKLSEAGRIANQVLENLGGYWGLFLFDDKASLEFINKLANSSRKKVRKQSGEYLEEEFSGRSASIEQWQSMLAKRDYSLMHPKITLDNYIEKNVAVVGLETSCSLCGYRNWHSLDEVSYNVKCTRCLKQYAFPQSRIERNNKNWKYRVVGPFAVPDFAQGAYASLLSIRFFINLFNAERNITATTAMELNKENIKCEIDFGIWMSDGWTYNENNEPYLIIGEAKSFSENAIKENDLSQLHRSALMTKAKIIVVSVLKPSFSEEEKESLKRFIERGEKRNYGYAVALLTGTELFAENLSRAWEALGPPFADYKDQIRDLRNLSDISKKLYLGLDHPSN